jgi:hypothetical protein
LPRLQAIYNSHCKRYFLPTISEHGLREIIEQPARLAGLDVSEVSTAIIEDARDEIGALPLVENALFTLWQQRQGEVLSGERYRQLKGIAGMLSAQADELLARIDGQVSKGRQAALELLFRLTRINDEGRHTRQRIPREEALMIAGDGKPEVGERVLQLLSGERRADAPAQAPTGALRLITISREPRGQAPVRRPDSRDADPRPRQGRADRQAVGYWPTLYDYIENNRDRDMLRQQLRFQAEQWGKSGVVGRWWNLAGWHDLWRYRRLRVDQQQRRRALRVLESLGGGDASSFCCWPCWAYSARLSGGPAGTICRSATRCRSRFGSSSRSPATAAAGDGGHRAGELHDGLRAGTR